jgi:hypothetical protein
VQLDDYFDFLATGGIWIQGTPVGIESVLSDSISWKKAGFSKKVGVPARRHAGCGEI